MQLIFQGSGTITLDDIKARYNAKQHPKVKSGEMTEEQALTDVCDNYHSWLTHEQFLKQFDSRHPDGQVTLDEWRQYYSDLSASVDTDEYWYLL